MVLVRDVDVVSRSKSELRSAAAVVARKCRLRTLDAALTGAVARRGEVNCTRGRNVPMFPPEEGEVWHGCGV